MSTLSEILETGPLRIGHLPPEVFFRDDSLGISDPNSPARINKVVDFLPVFWFPLTRG